MLENLQIAKLSKDPNIPKVFDINLEFHGFDSPVECEKKSLGSINPKYSDIWIDAISGQWTAPLCQIEGTKLFAYLYNLQGKLGNTNCFKDRIPLENCNFDRAAIGVEIS